MNLIDSRQLVTERVKLIFGSSVDLWWAVTVQSLRNKPLSTWGRTFCFQLLIKPEISYWLFKKCRMKILIIRIPCLVWEMLNNLALNMIEIYFVLLANAADRTFLQIHLWVYNNFLCLQRATSEINLFLKIRNAKISIWGDFRWELPI